LIIHGKFRRFFEKIVENNSTLQFVLSNKDLKIENDQFVFKTLEDILTQGNNDPENIDNNQPKENFSIDNLMQRASDSSDDLAAIFYTSGSTGEPKGVMLSHKNLVSNTVATVKYLEIDQNDSILVILPFYYIYGNSLMLTHILCGGTQVIDNRFLYPEVILDTMEKEKVTGFSGVPSNFMILLNKSTFKERKLDHLKYFTQAGGAMAPEVIRRLMDSFPAKKIFIMYGQTEASPRVSYLPPEQLCNKIGSIGIPVPGVKLKIVDDNGKELPLEKSGELIVSGDNVMLGYWDQPEETSQVLKDGWLYTGDLAKVDEDGYYFITGRKKEIIKTGGNRVSAKEIEECILEIENIMETAVIGIPDELLGEAVKAFIVPKDKSVLEIKDIQAYCREKLAEHKIPKIIEVVDSLPKYQSGKINKPLLKSTK
jgi:acyl-CoA synthetase (AMP-forming)/AMP-acid ligase II